MNLKHIEHPHSFFQDAGAPYDYSFIHLQMELNSQKANVWDLARDSFSIPSTPSLHLFQDTLSHWTLFWKAVVTTLLSDEGNHYEFQDHTNV